MKTKSEYLTVLEVSKKLRLHLKTVYRLCATGEIPHFKIGGNLRFDKEEIKLFIKAKKQKTKVTKMKYHNLNITQSINFLEISKSNLREIKKIRGSERYKGDEYIIEQFIRECLHFKTGGHLEDTCLMDDLVEKITHALNIETRHFITQPLMNELITNDLKRIDEHDIYLRMFLLFLLKSHLKLYFTGDVSISKETGSLAGDDLRIFENYKNDFKFHYSDLPIRARKAKELIQLEFYKQ